MFLQGNLYIVESNLVNIYLLDNQYKLKPRLLKLSLLYILCNLKLLYQKMFLLGKLDILVTPLLERIVLVDNFYKLKIL
jgi:hypothetical protein